MDDSKDFAMYVVFTEITFFVLLVTVVIFIYFSRKKVLKQQLETKDLELRMQKELLKTTIDVQEKERLRIAGDLHDDVSSGLNAILMNVRLLKRENLSHSSRDEITEHTVKSCDLLINRVRDIAHNLTPPSLDNAGLHTVIGELCANFSLSDKIKIVYDNPMEQSLFQSLSFEQQAHLYRIIQELITNSLKHAEASEIKIIFSSSNENMTLLYEDNGLGADPNKIIESKGLGMKSIKSRTDVLDAIPYFETNTGAGFRFVLTLIKSTYG